MTEILGFKLSREAEDKISDILAKTLNTLTEHGFVSCAHIDSKEITPSMDCAGESCSITLIDKCNRNESHYPAGTFHTHPSGLPDPSLGDGISAIHSFADSGDRGPHCSLGAFPVELKGDELVYRMTCIKAKPNRLRQQFSWLEQHKNVTGHEELFTDPEFKDLFDYGQYLITQPIKLEQIQVVAETEHLTEEEEYPPDEEP